jgi:hypothetical protein
LPPNTLVDSVKAVGCPWPYQILPIPAYENVHSRSNRHRQMQRVIRFDVEFPGVQAAKGLRLLSGWRLSLD